VDVNLLTLCSFEVFVIVVAATWVTNRTRDLWNTKHEFCFDDLKFQSAFGEPGRRRPYWFVHWAFCKPLHCVSPHSQFVLNESRIEMSS